MKPQKAPPDVSDPEGAFSVCGAEAAVALFGDLPLGDGFDLDKAPVPDAFHDHAERGLPSASISTEPSGRLRTKPVTPYLEAA